MSSISAALLFFGGSVISAVYCKVYANKKKEKFLNSSKVTIKLVLTGGPCAGKSSMMSVLKESFEMRGYAVFTVPEVIQ